jgi:homoserine dehydrogenase
VSKPVQLGLLGCGVVGGGVLQLLRDHQEEIAARAGAPVSVRKVFVRDPKKPRRTEVPADLLTTDAAGIVDAPEVDIVVEVMGGLQPAGDLLLRALRNRKPVVTANKELLAKAGKPLFEAAHESKVDLHFEASVCAGIPIIRSLREGLTAEKIDRVLGIVNGTTNYILTRMARDKKPFADALAEAQAKGYAEPDPSADVNGWDAAAKVAILASVAFHTYVPFEAVRVEGIAGITQEDIAFAAHLGYTIKSLALARERDGAVEARVQPTFIPLDHPLATVQDVYNAVFIRGQATGNMMFYGRGAGAEPTASAVLADVVDIVRSRAAHAPAVPPVRPSAKPIRTLDDDGGKFYLRLQVVDRPGVLAVIAEAFGKKQVSLESVLQPKSTAAEDATTLVFTTHPGSEKNLRAALDMIGRIPVVKQVASVIRIEEEV